MNVVLSSHRSRRNLCCSIRPQRARRHLHFITRRRRKVGNRPPSCPFIFFIPVSSLNGHSVTQWSRHGQLGQSPGPKWMIFLLVDWSQSSSNRDPSLTGINWFHFNMKIVHEKLQTALNWLMLHTWKLQLKFCYNLFTSFFFYLLGRKLDYDSDVQRF